MSTTADATRTVLALLTAILSLTPLRAGAAECDRALGQWSWFTGGQVTVEPDHVLKVNGAPFGRWECTGTDQLTMRWNNGFTNLVIVSADGRSIRLNQPGGAVFGTRVGRPQRPAASTTPKPSSPPQSQPQSQKVESTPAATPMPQVVAPKEFRYDAATERLFDQGFQIYNRGNRSGAYPTLKQAADRGHARAQALLGIMYRSGNGATKDLRAAAFWFEKAAAQEHRAAAYHLGNMYDVGDGIQVNKALAVKYYTISARQGFRDAQFELAFNHEFGQGTPRSRQMAVFWLRQAEMGGDGLAGWVGSFLRNPGTPHFQTAVQLRNYISAKLTAWVTSITPQGGGASSSSSGGGASSSGGDGCGGYATYGACNAHKAGNDWAADRIERGESPPSERAWFGR